MASLAEIEKALRAAKERLEIAYEPEAIRAVEALEKAKKIAYLKSIAEDENVDAPFRESAQKQYNAFVEEAKKQPKKYAAELKEQNKYVGEYLGASVELEALLPELPSEPKAAKPEPQPEAASPEAPTAKDVKGLEEGVQQIKEETELERKVREERAKMLLMEEKAAQEQRRIASLTPAQRLQEQVRAREQMQLERGKSAVAERREQMAAREMGKAADVMSGSFREGDMTQIVDPSEREAASNYFKQRAEDIRKGRATEIPRPTFAADRSLTVVEIDPRYRAPGDRGIGIGHSPQFGGAASKFFGPDRSQMQNEMIGGKPVPIMTGEQAMATQSRGTGINQYEKTGSWQEQLDARSARDIRMRQGQQEIDEKLEYALTGKMPARATPEALAAEQNRTARLALDKEIRAASLTQEGSTPSSIEKFKKRASDLGVSAKSFDDYLSRLSSV
jgi:hypothetical protein